ncbi:MAG: hypothetical protein WBA82_06295, partial [Castellaniella sp.]
MNITERRIDLNIGLDSSMPDLGQQGAGASRREASDADRRAFEQALTQEGETCMPAAETADSRAGTPKPFSLFPGALTPPGQPEPAAAPEGLVQALGE